MRKTYKSKVDLWLLVLLYGIMIISVSPALFLDFSVLVATTTIAILIFITYSLFNVRYIIEGKNLRIECAFLYHVIVNIDTIREIKATRSILSSPAASLDRIILKYGHGDSVIISPKNRKSFVMDILEISNKSIKIDPKLMR